MSKEEAIKKATAHAKKHKKKGMKDKPAHCCMENIGPAQLGKEMGLGNAAITTKIEPLFSALMHLHKNHKDKFTTVFRILATYGVEDGDELQKSRILSALKNIEDAAAKEAAEEQPR